MCDLKNGECRKCKLFQHILANTSFQMFEMGTRESLVLRLDMVILC